jgi:hypothetical protein
LQKRVDGMAETTFCGTLGFKAPEIRMDGKSGYDGMVRVPSICHTYSSLCVEVVFCDPIFSLLQIADVFSLGALLFWVLTPEAALQDPQQQHQGEPTDCDWAPQCTCRPVLSTARSKKAWHAV